MVQRGLTDNVQRDAMTLRTVAITPSASALVDSLRGLGYTPETALADLVDNSISADAAQIELDLQWNAGNPTAAVLDDGRGMNQETLIAALRLGGTGPSAERVVSDLGRFGLGLKTASLSQARRVTVVTRNAGVTSALSLDVDVVASSGWIAEVPDPLPDHPFVQRALAIDQGTVILIDRMDALGGLTSLDKESFYLRLQDVRAHLGMVFHRFLGGDARRVALALNDREIKPWDPFVRDHPATTELRAERIRHGHTSFAVKPYVLPHRDRFRNEAEYEAAGGPGGWAARQGFYVYRGKRLLVAGSWLGLGGSRAWTRDEASRLARIEVDLPTSLDQDWRIDVRKSQARPPGSLRERLTAIAAKCRDQAREVFAWRGLGPRAQGRAADTTPVWLAEAGAGGTRYRINRQHPAVEAALERSKPHQKLLNALFSIIEQSVPVQRIWLDVSESEGAPPPVLDAGELDLLSKQLADLARMLPDDMPLMERVDMLLRHIPGQQTELRRHVLAMLEAA
jgi:hypothetical protein